MLADNYLGRQIEALSRMLSVLVLKKDISAYFPASSDAEDQKTAALSRRLDALIADGNIGKAEDMLFESLEESAPASTYAVQSALVFYMHLNSLRDDELEAGGFSKEEIWDGLNEIKDIFGVEAM